MQEELIASITKYTPTQEDFDRVGARLKRHTRSKGGPDNRFLYVAFKAVANEVTVGELLGVKHWGQIEILMLEVHDKHRGKSIGRQLLAAVESFAGKTNAAGIHLWTATWQGEGFYEKAGYREMTRIPLSVPGHFKEERQWNILYHKDITPS